MLPRPDWPFRTTYNFNRTQCAFLVQVDYGKRSGEPSGTGTSESSEMNAATNLMAAMESLVELAGMTAFADDCDRLVKRTPAPAEQRIADSDPVPPTSGV